ncbi:MAG: TldD/PmbA family protein [Thermotogota bacterium]|nr:TldD/PmbA family protein [Thermotogota bacterium]
MIEFLKSLLPETSFPVLLKYQGRTSRVYYIDNDVLKEASTKEYSGISVRVWYEGVWGFASTSNIREDDIKKAINSAIKSAREGKKDKPGKYSKPRFFPNKGTLVVPETDPLENHSVDEKISLVRKAAEKTKSVSEKIVSSSSTYTEIIDEKMMVSNYGTEITYSDRKADFRVAAFASDGNDMELGYASFGATGGWKELFKDRSYERTAEEAAKIALTKLGKESPEGGIYTVVLHPSLVGVLAHEAIGHTVEADFVLSGSAAKGQLGKKVASELVTLVDDPTPNFWDGATGMVLVDDEGNKPKKVEVIKDGVMKSYLHDAESAAIFDVEPTGNARAFNYSDEPIIRMRNTYIAPGESSVDDLISSTKNGLYLKGLGGGGQADANAEFMFGVLEANKIENGKITEPLREVTISGQAFDVLKSVDAVANDFLFTLGAGYCGKHQPAKVDAGGPHLRCKVRIGGRK